MPISFAGEAIGRAKPSGAGHRCQHRPYGGDSCAGVCRSHASCGRSRRPVGGLGILRV